MEARDAEQAAQKQAVIDGLPDPEQVQAILPPVQEQRTLTNAEYAQANLIPGETEFEQDGRRYQVHSVDTVMDKVELTDLTFAQSAGYPILRVEHIATIRAFLETPVLQEPPRVQKK